MFALARDDGGLVAFPSPGQAVSYCEGIDVEDGVWSFFAEDGSPLAAVFDQPNERGQFSVVSGQYSLQPASGPSLQERLGEIRAVGGSISSVGELCAILERCASRG